MKPKFSPGLWLILFSLFLIVGTRGADAPSEPADEEGKRAYRDLAAVYESGEKEPLYAKALDDLADGDAAKRAAAGRYLLALFRQSFADETNGRAEWKQLPYWGARAESGAREFRKKLAAAFGEKAQGEAALDTVLWLADKEGLADGLTAAAKVLPRIESPRMEKALGELLAQPHSTAVLTAVVIDEVGRRKLTALAPRIRELCGHYRESVRTAARKAAPLLGLEDVPDFKPAEAFNPWLVTQLETIRQMLPASAPTTAQWYSFEPTGPPSWGELWKKLPCTGLLLTEKGKNYEILTSFGEVLSVPKTTVKRTAHQLPDVAREMARLQVSETDEDRSNRRAQNVFLSQFEPSGVRTPAVLIAEWCLQRGEREAAAAVLFPGLDKLEDDRWLTGMLRDALGNRYHQAMLEAFSYKLDYPRAITLADHLSQPVFKGYGYQERTKKLAAQLRVRGDDFKTFKLLTPAAWTKLRATMPRAEQIKYLAARLSLLNCFQHGQPGDVHFSDPQYDPTDNRPDDEGRRTFINPRVELRAMKLAPADLPALLPFIADENFLPTFSYWRDYHPGRTMYKVNYLVEDLVNDAATRDLVSCEKYEELDETARGKYLEVALAWCRANAAKSRADLLLDTMRVSKDWHEFSLAAEEAAQDKVKGAATVLINRVADFPEEQKLIAYLADTTGDPAALDAARKWIKSTEDEVRFWAAAILLRHGGQGEGFAEMKDQLADKKDGYYYRQAIEPLLARKEDDSVRLACGILPTLFVSTEGYDGRLSIPSVLYQLSLTGRKEVLDFLLESLDSPSPTYTAEGKWQGKPVKRSQTLGDNVASWVAEYRGDDWAFDTLAPPKERAAKRAELKRWLVKQFDLLRAGKPAAFKRPL